MSQNIKFGWLSPVIGNQWSDHESIVLYQERHILPEALQYFDSLWIADHFYGFDARTDPFLEAWTTLTWLAAKFPDVMLCHHVLGHGYRPPALTAKMAATLQTLSGGRFILGIGAGWRGDEYAAYGYDFPKPSVRFAQLEEVIQICRLMWTQDHPSCEGSHYSIDDAAAPPLPEVVPPICIGAAGEKFGLPLVGRQADMWNSAFRGEEDWKRKVGIVHDSAVAAGRDPQAIEIGTTLETPLPTNDDESERLLDRVANLVANGVQHFTMDFGHPPTAEHVHRFAEQVIRPARAT
ncbi:MAG: LLM class flavin-dependent oxidoreductase [Actinobacteria bacterium]|nr:LLM class flavin-dependent oxidoreductase [Actinomycetota bacterium]